MNKVIFTALSLTLYISTWAYPTSDPIESIPLPPSGYRWVVNELLSDEFDGTALDDNKWFDHHPNWIGRTPGLFARENVALEDGYLILKGEKMVRDTTIRAYGRDNHFNISCAAVVSKTTSASYGYYECRFKASRSTLSSTFWLSTRGANFPTEGRQAEGATKGRFSQELDICECIGRGGDFSGSRFAEGMSSNVHYWLLPDGEKEKLDIRIEECKLKIESGSRPCDGFNTYGVWWRDDRSCSFYLNNGQRQDRTFVGRKKWGDPFDIEFRFTEPMGINLVTDTYPTPWIELPNDEELADPLRNRTYYDWVRAYTLMEASAENPKAQPMRMFDDKIYIASIKDGALELHYSAPIDRQIEIEIYDTKNRLIDSKRYPAPAGYANIALTIEAKRGREYTIIAYLGEGIPGMHRSGDSLKITF
ncbi:MAG: hypothetical protein SNH16_00010 [Rikenellaceae bacterium]